LALYLVLIVTNSQSLSSFHFLWWCSE